MAINYRYVLGIVFLTLRFCSVATAEMIVPMALEHSFSEPHQLELQQLLTNHSFSEVDVLLEQHAVDERGTNGATLLWWMANAGNYAGFEYLLRKGANPLTQVLDSYNVMELAAIQEDPRFLQAALKHGGNANLISQFERVTPIFMAVQYNRLKNVMALLDAGASPNVADTMGRTPVLWASEISAFDIVALLLSRGADPTVKDVWGLRLLDSLREKNIDPEDPRYQLYENALRLANMGH